MVFFYRTGPGISFLAKLHQESCRIGHIIDGIERFFQVCEGLAVIMQIYLHAADIDIPHALALEFAHGADRCLFRGQVAPLAAGRYRPRPGSIFPAVLIPPP